MKELLRKYYQYLEETENEMQKADKTRTPFLSGKCQAYRCAIRDLEKFSGIAYEDLYKED